MLSWIFILNWRPKGAILFICQVFPLRVAGTYLTRVAEEQTLAELSTFVFSGVLKVTLREDRAGGWNACTHLASPATPPWLPEPPPPPQPQPIARWRRVKPRVVLWVTQPLRSGRRFPFHSWWMAAGACFFASGSFGGSGLVERSCFWFWCMRGLWQEYKVDLASCGRKVVWILCLEGVCCLILGLFQEASEDTLLKDRPRAFQIE